MAKKVKSVNLFKKDYFPTRSTSQKTGSNEYKYSTTEYDKNGNVVMDLKFNPDHELEDKYENKYNNDGILIEEKHYLSYKEIAEHKTYELDENGKIQKAFKHYNDGSKDTIQYTYDNNGNLTEKITIDSYDEVEAKAIFEYEDQKLVKKESYEYDDLVSKNTFAYDPDGNLIDESSWTEDDNTRSIHLYDENGNLEKVSFYNKKDELVAKTTYIYNKKGKIVGVEEETPYGKNSTVITYDEKGNAIEQIEKNEQGEINNSAKRKFNDYNDVIETEIFIEMHGKGINQQYILKYEYEYFE
jgi:antitoxin component YwqK of YwqJK toxin-antitoxin module